MIGWCVNLFFFSPNRHGCVKCVFQNWKSLVVKRIPAIVFRNQFVLPKINLIKLNHFHLPLCFSYSIHYLLFWLFLSMDGCDNCDGNSFRRPPLFQRVKTLVYSIQLPLRYSNRECIARIFEIVHISIWKYIYLLAIPATISNWGTVFLFISIFKHFLFFFFFFFRLSSILCKMMKTIQNANPNRKTNEMARGTEMKNLSCRMEKEGAE